MTKPKNSNISVSLPFVRLERRPAEGSLSTPEIIASDGTHIRRVVAADRQIYLQDSSQDALSQFLVAYIKDGLHRGEPLIGYTMLDDARAVCVRATGEDGDPGWMAYADTRSLPTSLADALPHIPRRRLVAGANTHGHSRKFQIVAALEERGDSLCNTSLLNYIDQITLEATRPGGKKGNGVEFVRLARKPPTAKALERTSPRTMQFSIPIDAQVFKNLSQNSEARFWLGIQFSEELVSLPEPWRKLHLEIRPR